MTHSPLAAGALLVALATAPLAAQIPSPIPLGPLGGNLESIAVNPDNANEVLIVNYLIGLFRSTDGGASYTAHGNAPSTIRNLTRDPRDSATLLATNGTTILRSTDFGATWNTLGLVTSQSIKKVVAPTDGDELLAMDAFNVHHSTDNGATWSVAASTVPFAGEVFADIAYAPGDSTIAYFGSDDFLYKSTDGGATFTTTSFTERVRVLTVSPSDSDTILIATSSFNGSSSYSMWRSTDGASTFVETNTGLISNLPYFLEWEPSGSVLWHGGLTKMHSTSDNGNTWVNRDEGFIEMPAFPGTWELIPVGIDFSSNNDRYLATTSNYLNSTLGGGVYVRNTLTEPWNHVGLSEVAITEVAIAPGTQTRIAGSGAGPLVGAPGELLTASGWSLRTVAMVVDPTDPDRWITGGVGAFGDNGQIVVLTNGGTSVNIAYEQLGSGEVQDIAVNPSNPSLMVGGIFPGSFGNAAIIRSSDGGNSWSPVAGTAGWATRAVAFNPHVPGQVVQLSDNNQWAVSSNNGQTWSAFQPSWPGTGAAVLFEFDPFIQGILYRGDQGSGLWRSDNGGVNWNNLGVTMHRFSDILLHPEFPGLLWVSDASGEVLVSGDRGNTFATAFVVPQGANGSGLAIDLVDGSILVGTDGASAWELPVASPQFKLGDGSAGAGGIVPRHYESGLPQLGNAGWGLTVDQTVGGGATFLLLGASAISAPVFGGTLFVGAPLAFVAGNASGTPGAAGEGAATFPIPIPNNAALVGAPLVSQYLVIDAGAAHPSGIVLSDGLLTVLIP